ncbi:MAG: cobalamin-independent methionine synthase II family protein [Alphaproteobacteria bacterium]|nr:cobalamin-independent methionine synthase II family protein [Alphaproteobacteria bacterium]
MPDRSIPTTAIGAYPKPDYVPVADWFNTRDGMSTASATRAYEEGLARAGEEAEALFRRAAQEVIDDQIEAGIDIPTDGEVRRENYIHYHCRHLSGFDFDTLTNRVLRDGAYETELPTIRGPIAARETGFLVHDWRAAQAFTDRPVKTTIPGPITIADTTADAHYGDPAALARDLADALNAEVRALAEDGARVIQIDEPLFARKVDEALAFGMETLERCFHGVGPEVTRVVHICCGYPNYLDQTDYKKADPQSYFRLADALDALDGVDQVSIEDAHRHNDLSLLDRFGRKTVVFGCLAIARSEVETVEGVRERLAKALDHLDRDRLVAAPDCGLGHLTRDLARAKLKVMVEAAKSL